MQTTENPVKSGGRANVVVYKNNDVDVRVPQEHEGTKLQKVSKTRAGSLSQTQEKETLQLHDEKTRADAKDLAANLSEKCAKLLSDLSKDDAKLLKIGVKLKGG